MALVSLTAVSRDGREDLFVRFAEDVSFSCSFSGTAPAVDFESTGFSAGRMVKKDGAVQPEYHVNDYLCSVRVVTDSARRSRDSRVLHGRTSARECTTPTSPAGQHRTLWQKSIPASARMSTAMTIR